MAVKRNLVSCDLNDRSPTVRVLPSDGQRMAQRSDSISDLHQIRTAKTRQDNVLFFCSWDFLQLGVGLSSDFADGRSCGWRFPLLEEDIAHIDGANCRKKAPDRNQASGKEDGCGYQRHQYQSAQALHRRVID